MNISNHSENNSQQLNIWYCRECDAVHFRVGVVMLNFTREEFKGLTNACVGVYCDEFGIVSELISTQTAEANEDILASEMIA